MTIADLVAAPDEQQVPLKALAHVEFQLRVLGLLCAAAAAGPTTLTTPGTLDLWRRYIAVRRSALGCGACESSALDVAESINTEVATDMSIRQMRNQLFHGGPDPENVDLDALHRVITANAERIVAIHEHEHVVRLDPFFILINGELAALNDYSEGSATYWPRQGPATDIVRQDILDELQRLVPHSRDRLLENFALDIQRDLRGFAGRNSIQTLVASSQPIVVRWELRTSGGTTPRIDRFELAVDHARTWLSESGPKRYNEFLAEICNWELLKERLLEELEIQVERESQISEELFPDLKRDVADVPALVRIAAGQLRTGGNSDMTIAQACERIAEQAGTYSSLTSLVTLTGEAGSGKTHSLLQFAKKSLAPGGEPAPVAIYISSSGTSATSIDMLLGERMSRTLILDKTSALALCRAGLAILVIDGFDEMLGFRTYDNPLTGLKPILDELRGRGTIMLSARTSYSEARLRQNLELHAALDWPPYVTALELLPWRPDQIRDFTLQLSVGSGTEATPEIRQLLITPFFCLAFAAWARSEKKSDFLQSVVDAYLQRERRKLAGESGVELFDPESLADIFSEVAELIARSEVSEISEEDLELAAAAALERALTQEEKRRLVALCGMSAEWAENDLSFKFTHVAIAEQFLARQIARSPIDQAVSLLFSVPISTFCAQLIVSIWRTGHSGEPVELVTALQDRLDAVGRYDERMPAAESLGQLWAKVHGSTDGSRAARRITIEDLELGGAGRVTLDEAYIQNLTIGPDVELQLNSGAVARLDLTRSSGTALLGNSYRYVLALLTQSELAEGPAQIKQALGLAEDTVDDLSETDNYFKMNIAYVRVPIIVAQRTLAPEDDHRLNWLLVYGLDVWQGFVRRMEDEGKIVIDRVRTSGRPKVRLRLTDKFNEG